MAIAVAGLDQGCSHSICGPSDLARKRGVLNATSDQNVLAGLNIRANLDRKLGHALQAILVFHSDPFEGTSCAMRLVAKWRGPRNSCAAATDYPGTENYFGHVHP
jgi:hypothetical protein